MDPDEFKVPKPPYYGVDPAPSTAKGEPTFDRVDNPGGCSRFSYRHVFLYVAQGGQYKFHCIPYGFHPVPPNEYDAAIHTHGGCNFFYKGWNMGGY